MMCCKEIKVKKGEKLRGKKENDEDTFEKLRNKYFHSELAQLRVCNQEKNLGSRTHRSTSNPQQLGCFVPQKSTRMPKPMIKNGILRSGSAVQTSSSYQGESALYNDHPDVARQLNNLTRLCQNQNKLKILTSFAHLGGQCRCRCSFKGQ